jgi:DNA topoisomerase IB
VAAKAARLRYVNDHWPGIVRERNDTGFVYRDSSDAAIADRDELARINAIAVPPAWTEVWICPDPDGPSYRARRARPQTVSLSRPMAKRARRLRRPPGTSGK